MAGACVCPLEERDFLRSWRATALLWRIPEAAFLMAFLLPGAFRPWIWAVCLTWTGLSCLANALRCQRRHCYLTGPFFLLGALALVLVETAPAPLRAAAPTWIAIAEMVGAIVLIFVPEHLWGRYTRPAISIGSGG